MTWLRRGLAGVWEFVVGDDWVPAAIVVVSIGAVAVLAAAGLPAWWAMPVGLTVGLVVCVRRG